jgi:hypothetical protein
MACAAILLDAKEPGSSSTIARPASAFAPTYKALEALAARLIVQYRDRAPKHYTLEDGPTADEIERDAA